jgi:hypothetical protein
MRYKATFAVGFAAGFVVGARAGRERYEQLKKLTRAAADSPAAQQAAAALQAKAASAATTARHKAAGRLQDGMASAKDHVPGIRHKEPDTSSNGHRHVTTPGGPTDGA